MKFHYIYLLIIFSIVASQTLNEPIALSNGTAVVITNTDSGYFNYSFVVSGNMIPGTAYILLESTSSTSQGSIYATVNASKSCVYNKYPTSLANCYNSGWGSAYSLLSLNFLTNDIIAISVNIGSLNSEFTLKIIVLPIVPLGKGEEVIIGSFGSSHPYLFSRYFQYDHKANDIESIYLISEGISSTDSSAIYVSLNCSNKPFNWFPSAVSYYKATTFADKQNYLQLNLDSDPCLLSIGITISMYNQGFSLKLLSSPVTLMKNNTEIIINSLNSTKVYQNFYRIFSYVSKEIESPGSLNVVSQGDSTSDVVRIYAKTNCSASCIFSMFPYGQDSCYATYYSNVYQILSIPIHEKNCLIVMSVLVDSYNLGTRVKILNYPLISMRNNTYTSVYVMNQAAVGVSFWRYFIFEAKVKGSVNILLEGNTGNDIGGIYAMTECEPGCAFTYFPSKLANCYRKYEAQYSFVSINLVSPCNISIGVAVTTISSFFNVKAVLYPILELQDGVPLYINSLESAVTGYELFYRYFKYTLKDTDPMGNLTITLEGLSSGDPNQLYITTDCQPDNCTHNEYPKSNNLFCYYTTYSTYSKLQIFLQKACTVNIAAYITAFNIGARIKASYYNICPNKIDKCVTCNMTKNETNETYYCYGCVNYYAPNPLNHSNCQLCNQTLGYFVDMSNNGFCTKCQPNCYDCKNYDSCSLCDIGYLWNNISATKSNCTCAVSNCLNCTAGICNYCELGFGLYSKSNLCMPCSIDNCEFCKFTDSFIPQCDKCYGNLMFKNGSCQNCSTLVPNCSVCKTFNSCALCEQGFYLTDKGACTPCGDVNTPGCLVCSPDYICSSCRNGYYLAEDRTCIQCSKKFSQCATCDIENCTNCNSGYYLTQTSSCQVCAKSNCKQCTNDGVGCDVCMDGYTLYNGTCKDCNENTGLTNCLYCDIGEINNFCIQCKSTFFKNENGGCDTCFPNSATCIECTNTSYCSQCENTGGVVSYFYINQVTKARSCVTTCPVDTVLNTNSQTCETCQQVFGQNCKSCTSSGCTQCDLESVEPYSYGKFCSACNGTNQKIFNRTLCIKNPEISKFIVKNVGFFLNVQVNCSIESKVFLVYGLFDSIDSIVFQKLEKIEGIIPTNDTLYDWIGYAGGLSTDIYGYLNVTINGPFKNSGQMYKIKAWCQSENTYTKVNTEGNLSSWYQKDNGGKIIKLKLTSTSYLNLQAKPLVAEAIQKTIRLDRGVYTEDGLPARNYVAARRILDEIRCLKDRKLQAFSYNYSFYIAPDFKVTVETLDNVINSSLMNSTLFAKKIQESIKSLDSTSTLQIVNTQLEDRLNNTAGPQSFLSNYPQFEVQNQTILVKYILQVPGKIYLGAKLSDSNYPVSSTGEVNATLSWTSFKSKLDYFNNDLKAYNVFDTKLPNVLSVANLSDLNANTTYFIFYGAGNNNFPENTTKIKIQSVKTGWLVGNQTKTTDSQRRMALLILFSLLFILVSW